MLQVLRKTSEEERERLGNAKSLPSPHQEEKSSVFTRQSDNMKLLSLSVLALAAVAFGGTLDPVYLTWSAIP